MRIVGTALTWLALTGTASAHGGLPSGTAPFVEGGELVGAWTSYGFIHVDGDSGAWTAEETVEEGLLWLHFAGSERLLAGTFRAVVESADWGCTWNAVDGPLGTTKVGQIAADPEDASRLFAFTDVTNEPVLTYMSVDRGESWEATGLAGIEGNFLSAVVAPGASTLWLLVAPSEGLELWRSDGVDASWQRVDVDLAEGTYLELRGTSNDGGAVYLSDSVPDGMVNHSRLLFLDGDAEPAGDPIVLASFEALSLSAFTRFEGETYVTVDTADTYRVGASPDDAELLESAPPLCGTQPSDDVLWGCGVLGYDYQFTTSTNATDWDEQLGFTDVCPAMCEEGTIGARANEVLWPDVYIAGVGNDSCVPEQFVPTDAGVEPPGMDQPAAGAKSGGCATSLGTRNHHGFAFLTVVGCVALQRRRRRVSTNPVA